MAVDSVKGGGGLADDVEVARDPGATTLEGAPAPGSLWETVASRATKAWATMALTNSMALGSTDSHTRVS